MERAPFTYKIRIMGTIVAAELLFLALVLLWPVGKQKKTYQSIFHTEDITQLQAPVRTRQQSSPPPPPAPKVPIPVPNDQPIQEDIKFPKNIASDSIDSLSTTVGKGGHGDSPVVGNPEIGPRVIRIVETSYKNKSDAKYEITVKFLVDKKGKVENVVILSVRLLKEKGQPIVQAQDIDQEIVAEVIKAALDWKFRPAKDHGKPVRSYTKNIFTI